MNQNSGKRKNKKKNKLLKSNLADFQDQDSQDLPQINPGGMDYTWIMERERKRKKEGGFKTVKDAFRHVRQDLKKNAVKILNQKNVEFYKQQEMERQLREGMDL